jgi:hypothetical protein
MLKYYTNPMRTAYYTNVKLSERDKDFLEFVLSCFDYCIQSFTTIYNFSENIKKHHSLEDPRTALAYEFIKYLEDNDE